MFNKKRYCETCKEFEDAGNGINGVCLFWLDCLPECVIQVTVNKKDSCGDCPGYAVKN